LFSIAASEYFEKMFCGHTAEATDNRQVEVRMNYRSDSFQVFLRWLYGESFEDACSILRKRTTGQEEQESYESYYLYFLIDLLKITDICMGESLKDIVEITIMKGHINIYNVVEVRQWARDCKAEKLKKYCNKYIKKNKGLIIENKIEACEDASDEEEKAEASEMLEEVLNSSDD
jgi:hypothetical protein